jgi:hypothetical protein
VLESPSKSAVVTFPSQLLRFVGRPSVHDLESAQVCD